MPLTRAPLCPAPSARIIYRGTVLERPFVGDAEAGALIVLPPKPLSDTLPALFEALTSGASFAVTTAQEIEETDEPHFIHTFTSGSSGAPKRIRRDQRTWLQSFETNSALWSITRDDRAAILGSLDHSLSLYALAEALWQGLTVDVVSDMRPDRQLAALREAKTTVLYATPTQARALLTSPLPSLRILAVGGGALSPEAEARIRANAPNASVFVFYGAAETSFITLADASTHTGSVGRPYPGVEIDIRNPDANGVGEIWIKSPMAIDAYAEGASASTRWDGEWITVGEMGRFDGDALYISGRRDRMFTVSDRNFHPEAHEPALLSINGIEHCAILPMPDEARGAVPVLFYAGDAEPEAALPAARALMPVAPPKRIFRLSHWPRLPSGKTDYTVLQRMLKDLI